MNRYIVRSMNLADIPGVACWQSKDPLWKRYGWNQQHVERELRKALDRDDLLLTVEVDGQAAGLAWCLPEGMFGEYPYLKRLAIERSVQGAGIGETLMTAVEQAMSADGKTHLFLLVSEFNDRARQFYERNGYSLVGGVSEMVIPEVNEQLFVKRLAPLA